MADYKVFEFIGHSDDTFGEYGVTNDDYDNCASGDVISYLISDPNTGATLRVTGQHCPGDAQSWRIGVDIDEEHNGLEVFDARFRLTTGRRLPVLEVTCPDRCTLICETRELQEAGD